MGRSQVLYNRTKGRYKNRGAGRGGEGGNGPTNATSTHASFSGSHKNHNAESNFRRDTSNETHPDHEGDDDLFEGLSKQHKVHHQQVVDESMVLLADTSMSGQRSYFYDRAKKEKEEEEAAEYSILEVGGSINVPSMEATFKTLAISQRLNMPGHLLALALRSEEESDESNNKDMMGRSGRGGVEDDDMSYTIAGTRNRATILSDGQVEVRPTLNRPMTLNEDTPLQSTESKLSTSQSVVSRAPPTTEDNDIVATISTASKESRKLSRHVIMQVISDDDPVEDKYFVLEASPTASSSPRDAVSKEVHSSGKKEAGKESSVPAGDYVATHESVEAQELEDWLDQTMDQTGGEMDHKLPRLFPTSDPPSKGGSSFVKKSKIPVRSFDPSPNSKKNDLGDQGESSGERTPNTPFMRQRYQKQRLRQQQLRQMQPEPEASSVSVTTESFEGEDDDEDDEDGVLGEKSGESYDVYSVDSRGNLFEDSSTDAGLARPFKWADRTSSAEKKNAMRDYVIHTSHQRQLKSPNHEVPAKVEEADEDGEDLDQWLDSVIE